MTELIVGDFLGKQRDRFLKLNTANGELLNFEQECLFAKQQITKTDYAYNTASKNPRSLQDAILNVSAVGISLNPVSAHAYLVPRAGSICLDISYKGLVKIATDSGAIKWAKCELVYSNDTFNWKGPVEAPEHIADPFGDRGDIKGGYCIAKLSTGESMVEVMSIADINKVRETSKAKSGPWVTWFEEMAKKTILKRAAKSWPQGEDRKRIDTAITALNEAEGTAYTIEQHHEFMDHILNDNALGFHVMRCSTDENTWAALYNSFEKGSKTKMKEKARQLEKDGVASNHDYYCAIAEAVSNQDRGHLIELLDELSDKEREFVLRNCDCDVTELMEIA